MILFLAAKCSKHIACILLFVFSCTFKSAFANTSIYISKKYGKSFFYRVDQAQDEKKGNVFISKNAETANSIQKTKFSMSPKPYKGNIGGPNQPEMSSFKSVGVDNMVNLFTGDFSYNIPLLDVGGYPVNLFYDGSISMEQEASWVGLGWNINPGNINRNMRGIPDDFNGQDTLVQTQTMKPNKTWGVNLAGDLELVGIKNLAGASIGGNLGLSFNNYLGPEFGLGLKGGVNFKVANVVVGEKSSGSDVLGLNMGASVGANLSSRSGFTISPSISLTGNHFLTSSKLSGGLSLSTSYNSRSGIKALQLSEQVSFNFNTAKTPKGAEAVRAKNTSSSISPSILSTTISFSKPSYIPTMRMPLTNEAYSGHFQLGSGIFGVYGSAEIEVYKQTSVVAPGDVTLKKPMVGYVYFEKANKNPNAVMDFTRLNDKEVTGRTSIISAPQYTYDVFSIQGEGTGGSIRPYRNDLGYVRDNFTRSNDKSLSMGGDIGIPGHYGANFNTIKTPSTISEWQGGNKLRTTIGFENSNGLSENVYFRNPGETSVLEDEQFLKIGGIDLVRFKLGGTSSNPTIEPMLQRFSKSNVNTSTTSLLQPNVSGRKKRTQVINFLTASEASQIALDIAIKSYNNSTVLDSLNDLNYTILPRIDGYRKAHHISQINVTEADGKRYVYGIPVYNLLQKDYTFSVTNTESTNSADVDRVAFSSNEPTQLNTSKTKDGYIQITETPPYAHSFLLTGLLSSDYVDVTSDGITEDDLGGAVKFNYTKLSAVHKWRTPLTDGYKANFNAGNRSETKDDKGLISYGEREAWYLHSVESKTMIALFTLENRADGKGAVDAFRDIDANDQSSKRLKKIDLYSKADLKKNGLVGAKPIKTVWFAYSYSLCANTPDNKGAIEMINGVNVNATKGKLTLDSIYFTFNGKDRVNKSKYVFSYGNLGTDNPSYLPASSDRWGNYKSSNSNPNGNKNSDYPYSVQNKTIIDQNAGAWSLKKILLPSGGQIEVEYESDDYAFVQNKRASNMMEVVGLGSNATTITNKLYTVNGSGFTESDYVFIKVPETCTTKQEVFQKYLDGQTQLAFKVAVKMPKGEEFINCYATIADYGVYDATRVWVRMNKVNNLSPLTLTALEYLREQLPGQAFEGYDVSESSGLKQIGEMLIGMLVSLQGAFKSPVDHLRSQYKAQTINTSKSFVRLNDPDGFKYGGGQRVKTVKLKDNWQAMTGQYTSEYGQQYDYATTEIFNGIERRISSGVASYEPSIGGEENPFQYILQVENKLPLGPSSYGAVEMPVLDAFFPSPVVGYSKVTVKSLRKGEIPEGMKSRSGIGKQVTEFYTAKDFPVYWNYTPLDPSSDLQEHKNSLVAFFYKYAADKRTLSQGFIVETNDMHGKVKSQSSYAENDSTTRINYTENFYRNTGNKGLDEKFDFVHASNGGVIQQGNMGIDVELMTDTREFSVKSSSLEIQGQVDLFPVFFPFWLPFIWPVSGNSENIYRAVTTTKVINYHSIVDSVIVIDKGSLVSTKNLVYDAETGDVVVNRTNNEFNKPVYTTTYPAWWAYSGMGPAYKNIDAVFTGVNFLNGVITTNIPGSVFESGDELYLINPGLNPTDECGAYQASDNGTSLLWAVNKNKNISALTDPSPSIVFVDAKGKLYTKNGVSFRIVRSGKRNILSASVASVTSMISPITESLVKKLWIDNNSKIIAASAIEYKEKWQTDNDVIQRLSIMAGSNACIQEMLNCDGYLEKSINPYRKGLLGNFRPHRSLVFYGERKEMNPLVTTNLSDNGFLDAFKLYWDFNAINNLVPDISNPKWVWYNQSTKFNTKGMELETKDALNIHTSAQYGFQKTVPIAITNNARYEEMLNENFEDKDYNGSINKAISTNCFQGTIDFRTMPNSSIVNTDLTNFNAHTGKFVLGVNANSSATKQISVKPDIIDSFDLLFAKDTARILFDIGGNIEGYDTYPLTMWSSPQTHIEQNTVFTSGVGVSINLNPTDTFTNFDGLNYKRQHDLTVSTSQYMQIVTAGNYILTMQLNTNSLEGSEYNSFNVVIVDKDNNPAGSYTIGGQSCCASNSFSIYLCPGIYKISCWATNNYSEIEAGAHAQIDHSVSFSYGLNSNSQTYKTLGTQNGCVFIKPLAATDSMLHNGFSIPANKKMIFSAWVKENCGDIANGIPCLASSYINNEVSLQFNNGGNQTVTLKPFGPIIEGWQRYESEFTAPVSATTLTVRFVNKSNQVIYFDDIRIHPYNAVMKSFVYDPVNLKLLAELDANNYATYYEYDEEGVLVRVKAETKEGIKTLKETRSFQQTILKQVQ